jgi:hypothetical protein
MVGSYIAVFLHWAEDKSKGFDFYEEALEVL